MAKRRQTFERAARKRRAEQRARAAIRSSDGPGAESETAHADAGATKAEKASPKKKAVKQKAAAGSED